MSLMNLLAANKSVRGVGNEPSPFKAADTKKVVPDFGFEKRPEARLARERAAAAADLFVAKPAPAPVPAAAAAPTPAPAPAPASAPTMSPAADVVIVARQSQGQPTLRKMLFGKDAPGRPGGMAQTEMSLSDVKVVRNDLSDADLELVRKPVSKANPFSGSTPLPSVSAEQRAEKSPGLIQRILGKVRGGSKSAE